MERGGWFLFFSFFILLPDSRYRYVDVDVVARAPVLGGSSSVEGDGA